MRPRVYGCRGLSNNDNVSADSMICPVYMTATPLSRLGNHAQVVGDDHDGCLKLLPHFIHQFQDLGLNGNVQSRGGVRRR